MTENSILTTNIGLPVEQVIPIYSDDIQVDELAYKLYDTWDNYPEEICKTCHGTGMDKDEWFDCEDCFGEGVTMPVLSDLPELTGAQR